VRGHGPGRESSPAAVELTALFPAGSPAISLRHTKLGPKSGALKKKERPKLQWPGLPPRSVIGRAQLLALLSEAGTDDGQQRTRAVPCAIHDLCRDRGPLRWPSLGARPSLLRDAGGEPARGADAGWQTRCFTSALKAQARARSASSHAEAGADGRT